MTSAMLLSAIIFLPTVGALIIALGFNKTDEEPMRIFALAITVATFILTIFLFKDFRYDVAGIQPVTEGGAGIKIPWIGDWNIYYQLGYDGISLPLVLLTSFICMLAMLASWSINKQVKGYLVLFLILETGMLGVFLALDFFLFYVFWEVMLLPMYFLIGIWGGPRKEYAAIKFFLYTLVGGVLMLIAILMFYFGQRAAATRSTSSNCRRSARGLWRTPRSARLFRSRPSSCSSSALPSKCRPFRSTPGCPMPTSRHRHPSA